MIRRCAERLPYAVRLVWRAVQWALSVRIVVLSSADPLHNGGGKRGYSDILGLLRDMVWKRLAAQKMVYFLCCDCGLLIFFNIFESSF